MQSCGVFLLEGGFPAAVPGLRPDTPSGTLPFWGLHRVLDFAVASDRHRSDGLTILGEERFRGALERLPAELRGGADSVEVPPAGGALAAVHGVTRLALGGSVTDTDLAESRTLLRVANESLQHDGVAQRAHGASDASGRAGRARVRRWPVRTPAPGRLFPAAFETIVDLPGTVFFREDLTRLYEGNLWLARHSGTPVTTATLARLRPVDARAQTVIERGAEVRHSFLAPGCRVEGYGQGSALCPGVVVHKGAVVYNSVVMTGNRIGARARHCRALLMPEDGPAATVTIGEGSSIGQKASAAGTLRHPRQIRDGLTVVGPGVAIPRGFSVGPGCLVGAGVTGQSLKGRRELRKGSSILCTTDR